jgi:hypothetical protein
MLRANGAYPLTASGRLEHEIHVDGIKRKDDHAIVCF